MVPLLELPQGGEWVVILIIVVLLFGAKKLPELSRNAARAMVEFKKATADENGKPASLESGGADLDGGGAQSVGEERRGG
ncbi:twin-arginine translocase TatA/TatE family subunit [Kribbella sp. NPDC050124]|uniref:twin-arginine translocase TatA/TatE family subunit n=1 Tax=Kribbella sp. NPDC050124 TaxID=3364114 RepID=UPI0037A4E7B8